MDQGTPAARRAPQSHGDGVVDTGRLKRCGVGVLIEAGVRIFHPETISLGDRVYIGHETILKGYHRGSLDIGDDSWVGQRCFFHSAGGIRIGREVGIGPEVKMLTSAHAFGAERQPVIRYGLTFAPIEVEDGVDLGIASILLPGVRVGEGAVIGAGSVVTHDVPPYEVWAGVPARFLRRR